MDSKALKASYQIYDKWQSGDAERIKQSLEAIEGIINVSINPSAQRITATYQSTDRWFPNHVQQVLFGLGFKRVYRL
jgi:copper chaperone CopZ